MTPVRDAASPGARFHPCARHRARPLRRCADECEVTRQVGRAIRGRYAVRRSAARSEHRSRRRERALPRDTVGLRADHFGCGVNAAVDAFVCHGYVSFAKAKVLELQVIELRHTGLA